MPSPAGIERDKGRLGRFLDSWSRELEARKHERSSSVSNKLAYKLDHKYTDAKLHLAHLEGKDRIKAVLLKHVCEVKGFVLALANVQRVVWGDCDVDEEDSYSCTLPNYEPLHSIGDVRGDNLA